MLHIAIISSSVRTGRKSHRIVLYFRKYIEARQLASVDILDLKEYDFPVFDERFSRQHEPTEEMQNFRKRIL